MHGRVALGLAALAFLAFPAAASAGPAEDFAAVFEDWRPDGEVSPCRWSQPQLENTVFVTGFVADLAYSDFPAEVARELGRWKQGRCAPQRTDAGAPDRGRSPGTVVTPARPPSPAARAESPIGALRIVRVRIRGNARREYVRIANTGRRTARLSGATIRNGRRLRLRLPRSLTIRGGRAVTVYVRCARGTRRAVVRGSRVYACSRRRSLFADRGDIAKLADGRGTVISQRGSGRNSGARRF
ncbi:MAG: hypothetical protein WD844_05505 [Thermoleophilaceae bacterium]